MKPSETSRGLVWLEQFEKDDRQAAARLVDAIRFVPGGDVIAGVRRATESFISSHAEQIPVALAPILAREDMRSHLGTHIPDQPIVFTHFDPSQDLDSEPGSEALMAHLIREVRRATPREMLVPTPLTIEGLKNARARTLVCLTDYIGSGQQVSSYVDAWCRHPTIRSWRSYGLIKIVVIAYAATAAGRRLTEADRHVDELEVVEVVPARDHRTSAVADPKIEEVCRLYARRGGLNGPPLGHGGSAGLFASSFSVPNNLPAILIRRSSRWTPFFTGRSVTAELSEEIGEHRPDVDMSEELARVGETRLAARYRNGHVDPRWHEIVGIMALLPKGDDEIALAIGSTLREVRKIRTVLADLCLIDESGRLTSAGKQVLASHRRKARIVSAGLNSDASPYYPRLTR